MYFIHGWPGSFQPLYRVFREGGHFDFAAIRRVVDDRNGVAGLQAPEVHFAITYPLTEGLDEHGQPLDVKKQGEKRRRLPHPGGMSGSLVWKTNRVGAVSGWTPERATVVGLAHRFDPVKQCLIVTRVEYVKEFLLCRLREERTTPYGRSGAGRSATISPTWGRAGKSGEEALLTLLSSRNPVHKQAAFVFARIR